MITIITHMAADAPRDRESSEEKSSIWHTGTKGEGGGRYGDKGGGGGGAYAVLLPGRPFGHFQNEWRGAFFDRCLATAQSKLGNMPGKLLDFCPRSVVKSWGGSRGGGQG